MRYSEKVVFDAWIRASGSCEKCSKTIYWGNRGKYGLGPWEPHYKKSNIDTVDNCQILCWDCHTDVSSTKKSAVN
ncbi:HNH endonuclease [candidate division KSB1 bacterium]